MPDNQKVIKRLEECLSASCRGFRTCPYSDDEWDAVKTALALLKEQEPVKPIKEGSEQYRWFRCGKCAEPLYGPWNYCQKCGRKVKWDG